MDSGDIIRKKLTSPVLLLIHSIPVRDRIDSVHDVPVRRVSLGGLASYQLYSPKYRESSLWSAGNMGVPSMKPPFERRDDPKSDF